MLQTTDRQTTDKRQTTFTTSSTQTSPLLLHSGVPQGSGLGPTSFLTYTEGTVYIFSAHSLFYHLYADDTQTYGHCSTSDIPGLISRLTFCISDLVESYSALRLQLNPSKTELIWFGTRCNLNKIPHEHFHSPWDRLSSHPLLGVPLDSELSMKHHISKVTSTCYYHLRRLHQIRNYVCRETMIQLVMSFVISRIDYCNSVLVVSRCQHSPLSNGSRMPPPGSFSALVVGLTSPMPSYNFTRSE